VNSPEKPQPARRKTPGPIRRLGGAIGVVGLPSFLWYALYRVQLRSGWLRSCVPARSWEQVLAGTRWTGRGWKGSDQPPFLFGDPRLLGATLDGAFPALKNHLRREIDCVRTGRFALWADSFHDLGFPPEWNRNPLTGRGQPADAHWTRISERATGDVKGLWELSRFSFAFPLVRWYALTADPQAPELFWRLLDSWLAANPPQQGGQWLSAQEAGLRAMACLFALRAFSTPEGRADGRSARLVAVLGEHARRITATLAYARAQNNNHLIAEAAALFIVGMQCPRLSGAERWQRTGRDLLVGASAQFFADGGYIQHSHNYHRLALQLLLLSSRLAELAGAPLPAVVADRMRASLRMLLPLVDPTNGRVPNFGHNDGALFLPLSMCAYEDYRPLVQSLSLWLDQRRVYRPGPWDEEAVWLLGGDVLKTPQPEDGSFAGGRSFPNAGLFLLRGNHSRVWIRCAHFQSRPAHADQLHVDLWLQGENIACDAGSFLYSGAPPWENPFTHAALHNTVTVDGFDQMARSGRFRWESLAQGTPIGKDGGFWLGSHDGYRAIGVEHRRRVELSGEDNWIVSDELSGSGTHTVRLHWLTPDYPWKWDASARRADLSPNLPDVLDREGGSDAGMVKSLRLRTPAGDVSLQIWSNRTAQWTIYRAGKPADRGEDEQAGPIPPDIRGWRSLRYASKTPALSVAVSMQGDLPLRFVSVWRLSK
jgi:hypothetical protein